MAYDWEMILTIGWFALWFLFPLGIFLSVGRLDKDSDELDQIKDLRVDPPVKPAKTRSSFHVPHLVSRH
jgi:hypothetical protein